MQDLVIVGAGSHGRGIKTIVDAINARVPSPVWNFLGFLDDRYKELGQGVIGPVDTRLPDCHYVLGINDSQVRSRLDLSYLYPPQAFATLIHPSAIVGPDCNIGRGCVVQAGCILTGNVTLGRNVHVNVGSTISQGTLVLPHSTISPGVHIAGEVQIGYAVHIGIGASVINLVSIGDDSIIGAGAVVVDHVEANSTVVGVPAKKVVKSE